MISCWFLKAQTRSVGSTTKKRVFYMKARPVILVSTKGFNLFQFHFPVCLFFHWELLFNHTGIGPQRKQFPAPGWFHCRFPLIIKPLPVWQGRAGAEASSRGRNRASCFLREGQSRDRTGRLLKTHIHHLELQLLNTEIIGNQYNQFLLCAREASSESGGRNYQKLELLFLCVSFQEGGHWCFAAGERG